MHRDGRGKRAEAPMEKLVPKDHGEEIAVFRSQLIGQLVHRALLRGDLGKALSELSKTPVRPPGADHTHCYSVPTLERWYYRFKKSGLSGLTPRPRSDRGFAQALTEEQRQLICEVRREHPSASAELILRTLVAQGHLAKKATSATSIRRLLVERGLTRDLLRTPDGAQRQRWEASHAGALWHGDVCHGPLLSGGTRHQPLRIHGLLDDQSRFVVALEARSSEREDDMLGLLVAAVRRFGLPDGLYLDNGSTYSGKALATACARLGVSLVHARPYDPQARGKMERFWRSLREALLNHIGTELSLAQIQARLDSFLATHYHCQPHGSLAGQTPAHRWAALKTRPVTDEQLASALTICSRRRVSKDGVLSIDGQHYEVRQGFLAGRIVEVHSCLVEGLSSQARIQHDGRSYELRPLDVQLNAKTRRPPRSAPPVAAAPFDPFKPQSTK
jgi:putative transposase